MRPLMRAPSVQGVSTNYARSYKRRLVFFAFCGISAIVLNLSCRNAQQSRVSKPAAEEKALETTGIRPSESEIPYGGPQLAEEVKRSSEAPKFQGLILQRLSEGITPARVPGFSIQQIPRQEIPPSTRVSLRPESGYFQAEKQTTASLPIAIQGAPSWFARLVGADFQILLCPHEPVAPTIRKSAAEGAAQISFSPATWIEPYSREAQRFGLLLYLAFDGPIGNLLRLSNLFPDLVAPARGMPYSPFHPFGAALYAEYLEAYLTQMPAGGVWLVQPAPPLSPLTRDLQTHKSFRRAMESRYSSIEEANAVWGTRFEGFWEVVPPELSERERVPEVPFLAAQPQTGPALLADWRSYLWSNTGETAEVLTLAVRDLLGREGPSVVAAAADPLNAVAVALGADCYRFETPVSFRFESDPVLDLTAAYLLELAASSGRPVVDSSSCQIPGDLPLWKRLALLRFTLWHRFWHGAAALVLPHELGENLLALPRFAAELRSAFAPFAPLRRTSRRVLFLHPEETLRVLDQLTRRRAFSYVVAWYRALVLQGFQATVVASDQLDVEDLQGTRVVVCPLNFVLNSTSYSLLEKFVHEGGLLITDWGSLSYRDGAGRKRLTRRLLGLQVVCPLAFSSPISLPDGNQILPPPRPVDQTQGGSAELLGAEPVELLAGRTPLAAANRYGQGFAYSVLVSLPEHSLRGLLGRILWKHGVQPPVRALLETGQEARWVETGALVADSRTLVAAFNLGPKWRLFLSITPVGGGPYMLRNPLTGAQIPAPTPDGLWKREDLARGVPVKLDRGEAAVVLVESQAEEKHLRLRGIAPSLRKILERLAAARPKAGPLVLIPPEKGTPVPFPTARALLEETGLRTELLSTPAPLSQAAVLWINPEVQGLSSTAVLEFVENGGGLLLEAAPFPGKKGSPLIEGVLTSLGLGLGQAVRPAADLQHLGPVICRGIGKEGIAEGLQEIFFPFAFALKGTAEGREILIYSDKNLSPVGAPLVITGRYGKGRFAVIGSARWASPGLLEQGDNARLLIDLVHRLLERKAPALSEAELHRGLFLTAEALAFAEAEAQRVSTFASYPIGSVAKPFPDSRTDDLWATFEPRPENSTPGAGPFSEGADNGPIERAPDHRSP